VLPHVIFCLFYFPFPGCATNEGCFTDHKRNACTKRLPICNCLEHVSCRGYTKARFYFTLLLFDLVVLSSGAGVIMASQPALGLESQVHFARLVPNPPSSLLPSFTNNSYYIIFLLYLYNNFHLFIYLFVYLFSYLFIYHSYL